MTHTMYRVDDALYERLLSVAALTPLEDWSAVRVTGADGQEFLNKFCTQDLKSLGPGQGAETFFTSVKGKVLAAAFVLAEEGQCTLLAPAEDAAALITHLDRYCIREDVQFIDVTDATRCLLVYGQAAGARLAASAGVAVEQLPGRAWDHAVLKIGGERAAAIHCPLLHAPAWIVATDAPDAVVAACEDHGIAPAGAELYHTVRIESGWPLPGVDYTDDNLPQEVARDAHAISFRKGCYLGQETVARIDALGRVNRQFVTLAGPEKADEHWAPGTNLLADEQVVGQLTSACWSPRLARVLGLGMLKRSHAAAGALVQCGDLEAEVVATPAASAGPM